MATAGKINGHDLLVYAYYNGAGGALSHSTTCSLTVNTGTVATTSKDSHKWVDKLPGCRDWTMETSGMVALDATWGIEELYGYINSGRKLTLKFATSDGTDKFYTGKAYITSLSCDAPDESPSTWSATFRGTGRLRNSTT
jgi:predicted secreted protein